MDAVVLDCETTGKAHGSEPVEVAWVRVSLALEELESFECRYAPLGAITLGAMATHHITPRKLVGRMPPSSFAFPRAEYMVGHNVDFDHAAIGSPDVRRICTLALSRKLWPDADSHSLGAMMYLHYPDEAEMLTHNAHGAMCDTRNTVALLAAIFSRIGRPSSWEEVWLASEDARIPVVMPNGKHRGVPIKDVPHDYKRWLMRQPDVDPYLMRALSS